MKRFYSIPEIISFLINITMPILIFYFTFFLKEMWGNHIWAMIFGIWAGWFETRYYYKKKMQSNTQIDRKWLNGWTIKRAKRNKSLTKK